VEMSGLCFILIVKVQRRRINLSSNLDTKIIATNKVEREHHVRAFVGDSHRHCSTLNSVHTLFRNTSRSLVGGWARSDHGPVGPECHGTMVQACFSNLCTFLSTFFSDVRLS